MPVEQVERLEGGVHNLEDDKRHPRVHHRYPEDPAALELGEEVLYLHDKITPACFFRWSCQGNLDGGGQEVNQGRLTWLVAMPERTGSPCPLNRRTRRKWTMVPGRSR